jgi:hypothetical protein
VNSDADKVLDIFVRVNSGGTTLSYSDLLLSMATNQWQHLDAREEVRGLVQELNNGGCREFSFSKDVVVSELRPAELPACSADSLGFRCPLVTVIVRAVQVACGPGAAQGKANTSHECGL